MTDLVIDASVLLGYYLETQPAAIQQTPLLLRQLKQQQINLLSLWLLDLEVANGLRFSLKDNHTANLIFHKYLKLPITKTNLSTQQQRKALKLSYKNSTTVYDTAYHVLAVTRNATFLTCDQDYYKKAHHLGHIKLLS